jgi:putative oxidoreductase
MTPGLTAKEALASPWLTVRVQIALGLFFVVAALPKLVDPPSFAHMVYNYRLVPGALVNVLALVMPWLELLAGLALVLGIWTRTAAALVGALLLVFIAAISLNLARANAIECGCFDVTAVNRTLEERLADMRLVVLRDAGMLVMVAQIMWARGRRSAAGASGAL